jgi:hypothetical protein
MMKIMWNFLLQFISKAKKLNDRNYGGPGIRYGTLTSSNDKKYTLARCKAITAPVFSPILIYKR